MIPEGQQTYEGLEMWLKARRDEHAVVGGGEVEWRTIDGLLDEVRDAGAEGFLPWQREL